MRPRLITSLLAIVLAACAVVPASQKKPIFIFQTDEFWLNLHHFLYVLGRAQNKTSDASREAVIGAPARELACSSFRVLMKGTEARTPN